MKGTVNLNSYYQLMYNNQKVILRSPEKEVNLLNMPCEKTLYLCYPYHPSTAEEAEKLAKEGKIIKTNAYELVSKVNPELACRHWYGCSLKTKKYLDNVKKSQGLKEIKSERDLQIPEGSEVVSHGNRYPVYKVGNEYVVEICEVCAPDDYVIYYLVFSHKPSAKNIAVVQAAIKLELDFMLHRVEETFECWECGRKVHWLDIEASDFFERIEMLKENYCGC